jgi:glyoxylate/hydroxypyruvate reductase A
MAVLFISKADDPIAWHAALKRRLPDLDFRVWPETGDLRDIDAVMVWNHPPGELKRYPNLRLIVSLGAGVNHILDDPDLPAGVPIARIVDEALTTGMVEYTLAAVLRYHRELDLYEGFQREKQWKKRRTPYIAERRVGVLGLGEIGAACAHAVAALGFPTAGWSRTAKSVQSIETFSGSAGLRSFLARTDILVCVLPLTAETRGIINAELLAALPKGSHVINIARGAHVVDGDLLAAFDSGQIAGATLDVFAPEPLPENHPFWTHPKVLMTPHIASLTNSDTASACIAENLRRLATGQQLLHLVERNRGY